MQVPLQALRPVGHCNWHAPLTHAPYRPHACPQAPQLLASVCRSTQTAPQRCWVPVQIGPQTPETHVWFDPQVCPHAPQFKLSVLVSTQVVPHRVWFAAQAWTHAEATQVKPVPQTMPHPPQLAGSVWVFTHTPEQTCIGDVHESAQVEF